MNSAPPPSPAPSSENSETTNTVVNKAVDLRNIVPRMTHEDYMRRITLSQYVSDKEAQNRRMEIHLIKLVAKNQKIWDCERLKTSKFERDQWIDLAIQMHEKTGNLYHINSLMKIWTNLRNNFQKSLTSGKPSTSQKNTNDRRKRNLENDPIRNGGNTLGVDDNVASKKAKVACQNRMAYRHRDSLKEAEQWRKDIESLHMDLDHHFRKIKDAPMKSIKRKIRLFHLLWEFEDEDREEKKAV